MKFLALFIFIPLFAVAKTIYIVPPGGLDANKFFYDPYSYRDEVAKPFCMLRETLEETGYQVKFTTHGDDIRDPSAIISFSDSNIRLLNNLAKFPKHKSMLLLFEPPVVAPELYDRKLTHTFGRIFVMFDDVAEEDGYCKFYYPQPHQKIYAPILDFTQKKLAVFISSNQNSNHPNSLYAERRVMVDFFKKRCPREFDLFGNNWTRHYATTVQSKWETIRNYKFCFCFENMNNQEGYVTEKIFDAMVGGAIPIYYGASNIEKYVPKTCFIDRRDFASYEELYRFMKQMDSDTYASYIESIRDYFNSPQAKLFSIENFIQIIKNRLLEIED